MKQFVILLVATIALSSLGAHAASPPVAELFACNFLPGKGMQMLELAAPPGDHVLRVTAPGYESWQKEIALMGGATSHQTFRVELKPEPR